MNTSFAEGNRIVFSDLNEGYWAEIQVYELTSKKVINGFPDNTFRPDVEVTRAQFAAMVSRALKLADADSNFKDVPKSSSLYKEVSQAAAAGIIVGDGSGSFHPDRHVSRAEMAIMLDRAIQLKGEFLVFQPLSFADKNEIGKSAQESVKRLTNYQVMDAQKENKFLPNEKGTRVETTVAVYQMLKAIKEQHEVVGISHIYAGKIDANPSLRVRQEASTESAVLGRLNNGTIIRILTEDDHWYKIKFNNDYGFVAKDFVKILTTVEQPKNDVDISNPPEEDAPPVEGGQPVEPPVEEQPSEDKNNEEKLKQVEYLKGEVTASFLNVRKNAIATAEKVGQLTVNTVVNILKTEGDWHEILYQGNKGYIHKSFVKLLDTPSINVLKNKVIMIDPGHGGKDPGAVVGELKESDVVLKVSLLMKELLEAEGATVIMTRSDNTFLTLAQRAELANSIETLDLFLSVHANAATTETANGVESYWNKTNSSDFSQLLTRKLQDQLLSHMKLANRGVKHANFQVIRDTKAPSTLVELGFMTNNKDFNYMETDDYYQDAANGLFHGIVDYFSSVIIE